MDEQLNDLVNEPQHDTVEVFGQPVDVNKINSVVLKNILKTNHYESTENWNKNWHKHEKCCVGFLFGG